MNKHYYDTQILAQLKTTFGYDAFRPLQKEIVHSILSGHDVLALMQTGGGKSLCYQLPAILREGLTVVVSPLIALMKDQVDALQETRVPATFINSSLHPHEVERRRASVANGEIKLLYVAPERLMSSGFLSSLSSVALVQFAIDEAHCISEWGHDFRPEYRELKRLRQLFPSVPIAAFTATATRRVQADIVAQLGLDQAVNFRGSFNRPNLYYEVRLKQSAFRQLTEYLRKRGPASGIVYCQSRAGTETLAAKLHGEGYNAAAYHAGLSSDERNLRQEAFVRDDVRIIVATIAFGMGINKPDIRFVVHYDLPKNMEGYYQESGRAGRDGGPSDCILFYSYGDAIKNKRFIESKSSETERRVGQSQLQTMVDWAESVACRRRTLLAYFDELHMSQPEPCCDICSSPVELVDYTIPAQKFLSCVMRTGQRFGVTYIFDVLRGSQAERISRLGHDKVSTYGVGGDISQDEWRHVGRWLLREGYVRREEEFNAVKLTERGLSVLRNEKVQLPPWRKTVSQPVTSQLQPNQELFEQLRSLRKHLADERSIPAFVIFHDSTLRQMAAEVPTTTPALLRIQGVGERKLQDYGRAFLDAIAEYTRQEPARPETSTAGSSRGDS